MAMIILVPGDKFRFPEGYGIVLTGDCRFLVITGQGGRTGYKQEVVLSLPEGALLLRGKEKLPAEIKLGLDLVELAIQR